MEILKMNKIFALAGGVLALSSFANAQYRGGTGDVTPYGFSFRGGLVLPIDSNFRSINTSFFGVGIDYSLGTALVRNSETFLSLDWFARSLKGDRDSLFPINLNQRFELGSAANGSTAYAFVGIGAVVFNLGTSDTRLGGRVGLGTSFNEHFFGEAALYFSDKMKSSSTKATSAAFFVGYRF